MKFSLEQQVQPSSEPKILSLQTLESEDFQRRKSAAQIRLAGASFEEWRFSVKDVRDISDAEKEPTGNNIMFKWVARGQDLNDHFHEFVKREGNLKRIEEAKTHKALLAILHEVERQPLPDRSRIPH